MLIFFTITAAVFAVAAFIFNRFIRLRTLMREAYSGMDVQLKRRHDLIPNLVEIVKGYAGYEQKVFKEVTEMRSRSVQAADMNARAGAENSLTGAIKGIFVLAENYPQLKASGQFLKLQEELSAVEDQIQYARRYYNGTVRDYNILVESFPSNMIAAAFNFSKAGFFEIELATQRNPVEVKLS